MSQTSTYDLIAKSAQEAIQPYLADKEKLISVAKTLKDSHYKLLTTHAEVVRAMDKAKQNIQEQRVQAQAVLDQYDQHKAQLADLLDGAVGASQRFPKEMCTANAIGSTAQVVKDLKNQVHSANCEIKNLLLSVNDHQKQLKTLTDTKAQNNVLSQLIQTQLQSLASIK